MASVASDILHFHEKYAGTKPCDGFQRGTQTGNYLSHSNEGGSGGNGDEWRARGQREEEGESRLLFRTLLCQLRNVYHTHTQIPKGGKKYYIPQRLLCCGNLGLKKPAHTIYMNLYCTVYLHTFWALLQLNRGPYILYLCQRTDVESVLL